MRLLASGQTTVADTTDGYSVVLSPNNYTFQGTTDSVSGTQSVTATVTAHRGEDAVTADINASSITVPSGFTVTNVGTSPSATITITANNTVTSNGGFTVPVVVHDGTDNINFNLKFSYSIAFTGSDGRGVSSITDQYCLSTSQSSAIGNWVNELPAYQTGRYYWTRQHIVYSDGSDEYTDAVYDGALTTANGNAYDAAQAAAAAQTQAGRAETAANNAVASAGRAETAATTAETNAAQAIQDAADAKTAATSAQADAADAKTAAQNAQSDAADAATAAQAAQGSAATAASSASAAQTSAQNAEASAQSAQDDADAASTSASQAATSAQNAISSAQAAETAANEAKADAADAKTAAGEAKREAATATRAANGALTQLSTVEDVVDVLNWIQQHGTYTKSTDTEVVAGKYYFTRSGTSPNYSYTLVNNPTGNPSTNNYYECTGVDEAVTNYVTTHLALTNDGLYVVKDNQGYKLKLASDGAYVVDPTGQVVATYGESIFFDSDRPQRIGNNNVYLEYYDSNNDTVADALRIVGANITLQSGQTVEQSVGAVQSDLDSYKQTNNAAVQGNATDLANYISSNNSALEVLQTQIDGAIETWFYEVDPTTSNPPASSWNTDDKKKTHLGDLYYNTATGHVFRWQKSGSTYSWTEIQDIDATKALADAAKAQTTANNKRRVFVTTPTPPYDVGDLWVGGSNGDIKRCATAKADGQSYAAGDWVLASKYTDDTKANAVETALNNYKTTVSNTYVTNTTFETRAESIEGQVSSVETTTKAYADGLIEQEVTNRNAAITAKATEITTQVSETYQSIDGMSDYATKTLLTQTANGINTEVAKKVGNNEVISRINQSAESVTIDADKININGVITAGSIAKTADLPTKVSDLTNDSNYQTASDVTTTLSPYAKTADISSTYATKSTANLREQRIYITKASGTNSVSANTTWVTSTSDSQNAWTTKRPTYNRDYPVLFTAIQSQTVVQSGQTSCSCTTPVKDDTLTIIDGGHVITGSIDADKIAANAITANKLATDAIKSNNFQASQNASSPYSATGTFLDLSNGRLYMPNFGVDADGKAYINGEIIATSGKIGEDSTSYWEIGTQTDYNNDDSAALIGHGTSFIQTGDFQLSNGLLNTRSYTANHQITYPKYNNTYWDFGIQAPTLDTSTSGYVAGIDDNFFYIRNHANTIPSLKTDWNYLYRVDKNGNIYTTGQLYINGQSLDQLYASISDVDSSFLPTTGGTINGNLTVTGSINGTATKATQLTHTLSINNKTWDGSANTDVGTIGVAYGGTGGTTFTSGAALIGNGQGTFQTRAIRNNTSQGALGWTSSSVDNTLITTNTLAYWNGAYQNTTSNIEYVKLGKLGTVVTHDLEDFITTEGGIIDGSLGVTDLNAGSLVVTGAARFTNAIYGDLTGNADTADKVNHDLIIKLNSGTTEGTNMFTFNGNAAKTVNVTKSAIGLGNVENTSLSTWAGSANLTTTKVGTLAAAAAKGVDSSIAAASTSGNLPTSAAVATFVEGKGYVTSSGVTSVRVQATSPVVSSVNTAQTATLNTTISLADGYGDTKNPYASKTKNYVLAAPSDANGAPTFRALVADDIPTLTPSKVGLGNVTNNKQVKGLSSGTTNGHLVTWGADGYTVADSGIAKGSVATKVTLSGTDYTASSNAITITQANLQSAVQSTGLVLMTSAERSKLSSIQVSEGGTIDFSGVTASSPLTATVATDKKVNITHNTSGVSAGTYRSVTVDTYGHVTGGTNPTTLSGYGITDAKIASGVINLGGNTITPLTASSTLDATKLSGTASISTTGNAGTATKFSSNRTIALTGDVTGSASGDGSSGWSVATTVKDDSHNHTTQTFIPISTKTYTNITVTGNSDPAGWLYFAKMIPINNDYGKHAYVKYRLKSTMAGLSGNLGHEETDMEIMMYNNTLLWYKAKNNISNISYRPFYNHLIYRAKQAGITGGYGHLLGVRLQSSYNPTNSTYARTFEIEILETRNCSITFFDSMILYADAPGTGSTNYDGRSELNGTTQGDTHTGDANDTTTTVYSTPRITATTTPLMQNSLIMQDSTGAWQSICVGTAGTGTAKTKNTAGFVLGQIYYFSSGTIAVGNQSSTSVIRNNQDWVDFRYTSNCASTLTKYAPIYIVGTMNNGLFYLDDIWWTQTTPTSNDGRVYIPVGMAYDTPYYSFWGWKGAYYHDGTGLRPYVEASIASDYVRLDGTSKMTGNLIIRKAGTGSNDWASRTSNPSLIFETTDNQSAGFVFTQYDSVQAPSSVTLVGNADGVYFIAPNIKATGKFYGDLSGNAATATKATQDSDGLIIKDTYAKKASPTFTGSVTSPYYLATTKMTVSAGKVYGSVTTSLPRGGLFADGIAFNSPGTYNDAGWIRILGTGESDTVLEIATGDDGGQTNGNAETIVARQYNSSNVIKKELTILDKLGNTEIPGTLTIADGVTLVWNATTKSLDFTFAA